MKKFVDRKERYVYDIIRKIEKLICINVGIDEAALLTLYNEIETRGWLVELRGERICRKDLKLDGKLEKKSF